LSTTIYSPIIVRVYKYWTKKYDKEWKYQREYCKLLKRFLDLDDQIKDCGINDEWGDGE